MIRDYQHTGIEFLKQRSRALLLDDMGLGKTLQAARAARDIGAKKVLVICPPSTRWSWERELKRWGNPGWIVQVLTGTRSWIDDTAQVVVCSYSLLVSNMVVMQLLEREYDVVIVDEIHFCKSAKAKRTGIVLNPKHGIVSKAKHCWGLSGTVMTTSPIDLYSIIMGMDKKVLGRYGDWMSYTRRYCSRWRSKWGWDVSGASNVPELKQTLFQRLAIRRTKDQVLDELPERQFRLLPMDLGRLPRALRWSARKDILDAKKPTLGLSGSDMASARAELADKKVSTVLDYITDTMSEKIVVFGWHKATIRSMLFELDMKGVLAVAYTGEQSDKQKKDALNAFVNGHAQVFLANIVSAGTGLDGLQGAASHCVFAELPWTYCEIDQAVSRLHRMGQRQRVIADVLYLKDSLDEYVLRNVLVREKIFRELLDG